MSLVDHDPVPADAIPIPPNMPNLRERIREYIDSTDEVPDNATALRKFERERVVELLTGDRPQCDNKPEAGARVLEAVHAHGGKVDAQRASKGEVADLYRADLHAIVRALARAEGGETDE